MIYRAAADLLVVVHTLFVLFVVLGGLLVLRWRRIAWLHLPAAAWGTWIEIAGRVCPLTPLENRLRALGGEAGYAGSFVDRYLVPILYPPGLDTDARVALGALVILVNVTIYVRIVVAIPRKRR